MKTLFIGGIKSGKSRNAKNYVNKHSDTKPVYLATTQLAADTEDKDESISVEEALQLKEKIALQKGAVLVESVSVWISNMLYNEKSYAQMEAELTAVMELEQDIVFAIDDVSCSIMPEKKITREFVQANGKISQLLAQECDAVYYVTAGISTKIK